METNKKKKSWFRRHWVLTILGGIFLFGVLGGIMGGINTAPPMDSNKIISLGTNVIIPQDEEIDREWIIEFPTLSKENINGLVETSNKHLTKDQGTFSQTQISLEVYRFDTINNANLFYNQEKQEIDVRGVDEWKIGNGCFGIDRELGLGDQAKGICLRNNIVLKVDSITMTSWDYKNDAKEFMNLMLKKI